MGPNYAIDSGIDGTIVERTPADQVGPSGWMVRCVCGYKAGPFATGAVEHVNKVRDTHEKQCLWPRDAGTGFMSRARLSPGKWCTADLH
jgi:hypothetical protein